MEVNFIKTIFLENGKINSSLIYKKKKDKQELLPLFSWYKDTFAKLKIFISWNFTDLKSAYIFYKSKDSVNYYVHYNEFLE